MRRGVIALFCSRSCSVVLASRLLRCSSSCALSSACSVFSITCWLLRSESCPGVWPLSWLRISCRRCEAAYMVLCTRSGWVCSDTSWLLWWRGSPARFAARRAFDTAGFPAGAATAATARARRVVRRPLQRIQFGGDLIELRRRLLHLLFKLCGVLPVALDGVQQLQRGLNPVGRAFRPASGLFVQRFQLALHFAALRQIAIQRRLSRQTARKNQEKKGRSGDAPPACADKRERRQRRQSQPAMHDLASDR